MNRPPWFAAFQTAVSRAASCGAPDLLFPLEAMPIAYEIDLARRAARAIAEVRLVYYHEDRERGTGALRGRYLRVEFNRHSASTPA